MSEKLGSGVNPDKVREVVSDRVQEVLADPNYSETFKDASTATGEKILRELEPKKEA